MAIPFLQQSSQQQQRAPIEGLAELQAALSAPYQPPTGFWTTPFQRQQAFIEDQARRQGLVDAFLLPYKAQGFEFDARDQALEESKFELDRLLEPRRVAAYETQASASMLGAQTEIQRIGLAEKDLQARIDEREQILDALRQSAKDRSAVAAPLRSQLDQSLTPKLFAMANEFFDATGVPALQNEGFLNSLKDQTLDQMLRAIEAGRDPQAVEDVALDGLSKWLARKSGWLSMQQQREAIPAAQPAMPASVTGQGFDVRQPFTPAHPGTMAGFLERVFSRPAGRHEMPPGVVFGAK